MQVCGSPTAAGRRSGFTLIEVMVVIAIIGVLIVMTAGATLQVLGTQRASNTETTVRKLDAALQRQWSHALKIAQSEVIPDQILYGNYNPPAPVTPFTQWGLLRMAGGDAKRARVIWIKLRLKQQFPNNFMEALYPTPDLVKGIPAGAPSGSPALPWVLLPPDPLFSKTLALAPVPPWWSTGIGPGPGLPPPTMLSVSAIPRSYEGAVCLLLALSRARSGIATIQDNLAASETIDTPFGKALVDAWGLPLGFYRFAIGEEVNGLTPVPPPPTPSPPTSLQQGEIGTRLDPNAKSTTVFNRDPVDPDGVLMHPSWNNWNAYTGAGGLPSRQGVWAFEKLLHPVHTGAGAAGALNPYAPRSFYSLPVIASAGRSKAGNFGTYPPPSPPDDLYTMLGLPAPIDQMPQAFTFPPPTPSFTALVPDTMNTNILPGAADDNIYSYRIRLGGRGE